MNTDKNINGKIIAIVGPDGAGKTTLCKKIENWNINNGILSKYIYGSKHSDHVFLLTKLSFFFYSKIKKIPSVGKVLGLFYLYVLHYPIEFLDNIFKYKKAKKLREQGYTVVFDRYPTDRIIPMTKTFSDKFLPPNKFSLLYFVKFIIWKLMKFYSLIYFKFYPIPDLLFFLDVDEKILKERKSDYYKSDKDALFARHIYTNLLEIILKIHKNTYQIKADKDPDLILIDVLKKI